MKRGQKRAAQPQDVDVLLKERGTECKILQSVLRSALVRSCNAALSPVRITVYYAFTFPPHQSVLDILISISARHLRPRSLQVQQDMETIKVHLQSFAFMICQLPLMGSSCEKTESDSFGGESAATGVIQEAWRAFKGR